VVRLEVISADSSEREVIDITRAKIELTDSEARGQIFEEGQKASGQPYKIGVIDLPSFYMDMAGARRGLDNYKSTTRDVGRILEDFNQQAVDVVILDLRRNGGGSLQEAINLTGLFIEAGPVVQVKDADGQVLPYYDQDNGGIAWKGPLIVLTSKFSASASEILAGAVQDYRRGLVVGDDSTHGKGTVQSLMDLGQQLFSKFSAQRLGALKITMQQFYRPNGDSTQNRGVLADIVLPSLTGYLEGVSERDLDYPMAFDRVEPLEFRKLDYVSPAICNRLARLSAERVKSSEEFQSELRDIARYKEQKDKKYVTLNEEKFLKEREKLNADKEEKEQLDEMADPGKNGIERNYYLNEAIAIALDYLQLTMIAKAR
jgi:carboxyl-terminal processing protease